MKIYINKKIYIYIYIHIYIYIYIYKDIIVGQDKTQLLYVTSGFMQQEAPGIDNVYLSKKARKLTFNTIIQEKRYV